MKGASVYQTNPADFTLDRDRGNVSLRRANDVGTNLGGGGSEGEAGIHFPHTPFSARPARANRFLAREARHQFRSKKVRAFSNKGHS
jgi:hypothetical protein